MWALLCSFFPSNDEVEKQIPVEVSVMEAAWVLASVVNEPLEDRRSLPWAQESASKVEPRGCHWRGRFAFVGGFFRGKGESACVISHKSRLRRGIPLSGVVDIVAPISARQPMFASY